MKKAAGLGHISIRTRDEVMILLDTILEALGARIERRDRRTKSISRAAALTGLFNAEAKAIAIARHQPPRVTIPDNSIDLGGRRTDRVRCAVRKD
jgi:hypothetical protein